MDTDTPRWPRAAKRVTISLLVAASAAGLWLLWVREPGAVPFFPKCPSYTLLGLYCPGCGTARAMHDLLHLRIVSAIGHNALLVFVIPFLGVWAGLHVARWTGMKVPPWRLRPWVNWAIVAIVIAWWIGRNLPFPWAAWMKP